MNIKQSIETLSEIRTETEAMIEKIIQFHGYRTPHVLLFKNLSDTPHQEDDIIITPGSPPTIVINQAFVLWCLIYTKPIIYRQKISSALEHLHLMHRTLSHPIPLSTAIALRKENKNWKKVNVPNLVSNIAARYLKVSYTVTVKDTVTGSEIELHGEDPKLLKDEAVKRLSRLVFENEDMEEMHDTLSDILRAKNAKTPPNKLVIDGNALQVNTRLEY